MRPATPGVEMSVRDAGRSSRALAHLVGTQVVALGARALGLPLRRAALVTVRDGGRIYRTASTIYGADGEEGAQLAVDEAVPGSATEAQYRRLLLTRPRVVLGGSVGARVSDVQVVIRAGSRLVAITTPHSLRRHGWDALVSRLTVVAPR
jgi:hypothetical protein